MNSGRGTIREIGCRDTRFPTIMEVEMAHLETKPIFQGTIFHFNFYGRKNISGQTVATKPPVGHPKWWWKVRESPQNAMKQFRFRSCSLVIFHFPRSQVYYNICIYIYIIFLFFWNSGEPRIFPRKKISRTWTSLPLDSPWYQWQAWGGCFFLVAGGNFCWKIRQVEQSFQSENKFKSSVFSSKFLLHVFCWYPKFSVCFLHFGFWTTPPWELKTDISLCPHFFWCISTMFRKQEASPTGRWWLPRELILQLWPSVVRHSWHQWMVHHGCSILFLVF